MAAKPPPPPPRRPAPPKRVAGVVLLTAGVAIVVWWAGITGLGLRVGLGLGLGGLFALQLVWRRRQPTAARPPDPVHVVVRPPAVRPALPIQRSCMPRRRRGSTRPGLGAWRSSTTPWNTPPRTHVSGRP
ncbi:hypothetical protein [Umezawaea sp. Da 62-37]|uniref:hypothetical protein n=1 Tax=Umezawaea sp. Da 62-37 TaxID=3075927 RepID=UPI0028F71678|nr:hypothetical protein [Umezawaea sp. Da 62-37]WNV90787.1 hypothetical protein RM788_21655 [Umezawaea sp. Da 62-37]